MLCVALLAYDVVRYACRRGSAGIQTSSEPIHIIQRYDNCGERGLLSGSTPRGMSVARSPRGETKTNDRRLEFIPLLVSVPLMLREPCSGGIRWTLGVPRKAPPMAYIERSLRYEIGIFKLDVY